eukprot:TRINITY_DN66349_c4_g1_i2.p2 TRINITY_DN66349_c4_g1~~TRINITY_DN66349_c4_g1_i2.p2  ORF type:complete len:106 (-),score=57.82 TRINITY_DN66349_c4_g1_i2:27-344(-)
MLIDKDNDGDITFDEFFAWWSKADKLKRVDGSHYAVMTKALEYFKRYDKDNNGYLDIDEWRHVMKDIGMEQYTESGLKGLDKTGDGRIEFDEFLTWLGWLDEKKQ